MTNVALSIQEESTEQKSSPDTGTFQKTRCGSNFLRGILTIIGCMFVVFGLGHAYTLGNMIPYLTSYLRNRSRVSHDVDYSDSPWLNSGYSVTTSLTMPILGLLEQKIPSRICILIGGLLFSGSIAVTFFSVNYSFATTVLTYGVTYAMGKSLVYPVTARMAIRWFPNKSGLMCGILQAAYSGVAFVYTQIITVFINPSNLSPDQNIKGDNYFTQSVVLDKVPYCFLLFGGVCAVLFTVGVLLMTDPDDSRVEITVNNKDEEMTSSNHSDQGNTDVGATHDLSPKEVLQTPQFYLAWLAMCCFCFASDIFFVLIKPYGQTFIPDDKFLSLVMSFGSAANCVGNLFWGQLADKFTYKPVLMLLMSTFGVFLGTLNVTEYGGKPMFFTWVCIVYFSFTGIYVILPLLTIDMFGTKYYAVNYGLVQSSGVVFSLLSALATSQLKDKIGWHGLFFMSAISTIIGVFFAVVIYIKDWSKSRSK